MGIRIGALSFTILLTNTIREELRLLTKLTPIHKIKNNNNNIPYKLLKKTKTAPAPNDLDFQVFEDPFASVRKTLSFQDVDSTKISHLPPQPSHRKGKTGFLDLDETLVHSKPSLVLERYDFIMRALIDGTEIEFYVLNHSDLEEFLSALKAKFKVVIFTAALREYAELVLDKLDQDNQYVSHMLYWDSCHPVDERLVKDLSETGRKLDQVVILDNNPKSFSKQPETGRPSNNWNR
ncbi:putative C-terminal domain small phosphatase [Arachis hypogaea]|nr:putative C-terminal domain small phosphatase [Arachis hypogaea]